MAGTTASDPLDGLIDGVRNSLTIVPPSASDVEAELQRIARERAAPAGGVVPRMRRGARALRHQPKPLIGAFDSPEGFVFASDGANRRK